MAVITKEPKKIANSLSTKAGLALWNNLGPKTKKRLITSSISIITQAAARSVMKKTSVWLIVGAIIAGAIYMVNNQGQE